jgi:hypothetical protein
MSAPLYAFRAILGATLATLFGAIAIIAILSFMLWIKLRVALGAAVNRFAHTLETRGPF